MDSWLDADDMMKPPQQTSTALMKWSTSTAREAEIDRDAGDAAGAGDARAGAGRTTGTTSTTGAGHAVNLGVSAHESIRVFRMRPKDARTVSDLNWEGQRAVSSVARKSRRSALLADPRVTEGEGRRRTEVGPFFSYGYIPEKQLTMLRDIVHWFKDEETLVELADMISEGSIPLKLYDWFVAHYAKEFRMSREVIMPDGNTAVMDIHSAYWIDRWAVRKRHWDFLCKRIKVAFRVQGRDWVTSITQLNAFVFVKRFRLKALLLEAHAADDKCLLDVVRTHFERGREASERAAQEAAVEAAREAGIQLDGTVPLKRKRGRRRKDRKKVNIPADPIMLSEGSVKTRISLQDE